MHGQTNIKFGKRFVYFDVRTYFLCGIQIKFMLQRANMFKWLFLITSNWDELYIINPIRDSD